MNRTCARLWALMLVPMLLSAGAVYAQPTLPAENHYKLYAYAGGGTGGIAGWSVVLTDQFGSFPVNVFNNFAFANPTVKIHNGVTYPILDPIGHQMWWAFLYPPAQPSRTVLATDQFGTAQVTLGRALYLVNPALKNPTPPYPPLPVRNHYVCYEVIGSQPLYKTVTLVDQWGTSQVVVARAKLFCNPAQKFDAIYNTNYPIIDSKAHLQCYEVDDPTPSTHNVSVLDQFTLSYISDQRVGASNCLCVPALKEFPISTRPTTWGQIKALYR